MPTVKPLVPSPDEGETFTIGELRIVSRVQGGQSGGELEFYELEHVPPRLNRGDSREAKNRRVYRH